MLTSPFSRKCCSFAILLLCVNCFCTTAVVYVQPNLITVAVDRLGSSYSPAGKLGIGTVTKVFLLQGRLAVACAGLERYYEHSPDKSSGRIATYDFQSWAAGLESKINPDTSVVAFADIVARESSRLFTETIPINSLMSTGVIRHREDMDKYLVQYVVAGFDRGEPTVISVSYEFDWQRNRLVGPVQEVKWPSKNFLSGITFVGQQSAFQQVQVANTSSYERMSTLSPVAFKKLMARGELLSEAESVSLVRSFITLEAEALPLKVGRGADVVLLPALGRGTASKYTHNISLSGVKSRAPARAIK